MISGGRDYKEIERKKLERNRSKNRAKTGLCETSQPKEIFCKISTLLPNYSATHWNSLQKFSQLRSRVWHTSATSQHRTPISQLRNGCEAIKLENPCFRNQSSIPQGISQLRKRFWHTCATSQHSDTQFAAAKCIAKWAAKMTFCCEIGLFLRNSK